MAAGVDAQGRRGIKGTGRDEVAVCQWCASPQPNCAATPTLVSLHALLLFFARLCSSWPSTSSSSCFLHLFFTSQSHSPSSLHAPSQAQAFRAAAFSLLHGANALPFNRKVPSTGPSFLQGRFFSHHWHITAPTRASQHFQQSRSLSCPDVKKKKKEPRTDFTHFFSFLSSQEVTTGATLEAVDLTILLSTTATLRRTGLLAPG